MKEYIELLSLLVLEFVFILLFCGGVIVVEVIFSMFLFCFSIGDVYSWFLGGYVMYYMEFNNEIIV